MTYDRAKLVAELERDEGYRAHAYQDSLGYWSVGVGRCIDSRVGGTGISREEAHYLLQRDIGKAEQVLDAYEPRWRELADERQRVLVNMTFNLGPLGVVRFKAMWQAIRVYLDTREDAQLAIAAEEMIRSRWAVQVGDRAKRLAAMMRPTAGG